MHGMICGLTSFFCFIFLHMLTEYIMPMQSDIEFFFPLMLFVVNQHDVEFPLA